MEGMASVDGRDGVGVWGGTVVSGLEIVGKGETSGVVDSMWMIGSTSISEGVGAAAGTVAACGGGVTGSLWSASSTMLD